MPSGGKCAECERRGRPCVVSSWEALDRASDNLSSKISEDEKKVELPVKQTQAEVSLIFKKFKYIFVNIIQHP